MRSVEKIPLFVIRLFDGGSTVLALLGPAWAPSSGRRRGVSKAARVALIELRRADFPAGTSGVASKSLRFSFSTPTIA